jgi:LacI family transcriptional regulator
VQRLDGFSVAYAEAGHPIPAERVLEGDFTIACGFEGVQRALETGVKFDAIFAHNDLSATGAMQAVLDSGRRIPQDVAVVGFDDIPMAAHTQPPLTTVHQPLREMGEAAARTLLAHFEGSPLPNRPTVIPATFTARGSTAVVPVTAPA